MKAVPVAVHTGATTGTARVEAAVTTVAEAEALVATAVPAVAALVG